MEGLSAKGPGLVRVVTAARFGRQHLGHAPGGPQDRTAAARARAGLGLAADAPLLEVVAAPTLRLTGDARVLLTGAPRPGATLGGRPLPHATPTLGRCGDAIRLAGVAPGPAGGLRTYLAVVSGFASVPPPLPPLSARRPPTRPGLLHLRPGPEWARLDDPRRLLGRPWRVGPDLSDAGFRLLPVGSRPAPLCRPAEIASGPLADGCVQLTPAGPVVFLRGRPTLGGYPRVGCLPEEDVDRAAQVKPGACVRFAPLEE